MKRLLAAVLCMAMIFLFGCTVPTYLPKGHTEEWWQNFTLRAFNLSHSGGNVKMTAEDSSALRIYVPRSVAD